MVHKPPPAGTDQGPSHTRVHPDANERQAIEESGEKPIGQPGGFKNDPPDPTNPNEAIERSRRKLRP